MSGREKALAALERAGARYELAEHPAVFTVEEAHAAGVPFAPFGAKNLFLRDDKKRAYYLVTMPDEKQVPLKGIQAAIGSRRLSFASADDLERKLGLIPGAVTPLGALNDAEHAVQVVFDQELVDLGRVAVHPCDNTASVLVATGDLIDVLRAAGAPVRVVAL